MNLLKDKELLQCFRRNKTEMSCMDEPRTFLRQLRDHDLIPEERYEKVISMKETDKMRTGLYKLLEWIEKEQPQNIRQFWTCVFTNNLMTHYPTLKKLQDSLLHVQNPAVDIVEGSPLQNQMTVTCGDQQGVLYPAKLAKAQRCIMVGKNWFTPSAFQNLSGKYKSKNWKQSIRHNDCTLGKLLKEGKLKCSGYNKRAKVKRLMTPSMSHTGSRPLLKMRVTCGDEQGNLHCIKLAKGKPCILFRKWCTPRQFQSLGGKPSSSKWSQSIHCKKGPLANLLKNGQLKCPEYNKSKAKKSQLPCSSNTDKLGLISEIAKTARRANSALPTGSSNKWLHDRKQRGKHGGLKARLKLSPHRPSLPSLFLTNAQSLVNKIDKLRLRITTHKRIKDSNIMVFTETWLNSRIPNSVIKLTGRNVLRADRTAESGKTKGGGLCIYVQKAWCTDTTTIESHCSGNLEYLMVKCKPFYPPRGFPSIVMTAVYIPPDAKPKVAMKELKIAINKHTLNPEAAFIVAGDFNHSNLKTVLPKFHQHVFCSTRGEKTLDHVYTNIAVVYSVIPLPPLGNSDHLSLFLLPK